MILRSVKEKITPLIPRQGALFNTLRGFYKWLDHQILRWETRSQTSLSRLARKQSFLRSIRKTPDGIIVEFESNLRFLWDAPTDADNLLTMIIAGRVSFETDESKLLMSLLNSGDTAFDIGANFGWHSVEFCATVGENGKVYAFEPHGYTYGILTRNLALNFDQKRWQGAHLALSNTTGTATLHIPNLGSSFASLKTNYAQEASSFNDESVPLQTIDNFIEDNKITKLDFIKCDVEGAQLEVFQGGEKMLQNLQPLIYCEINSKDPRQIFDLLKKHGYEAYNHEGKTRFKKLENPYIEELPNFNFLFITSKHKPQLVEKGFIFK